jgi:hypothetical protein
MKKKKIKYDLASNGQEAVQKWRTGEFHLILVRSLRVWRCFLTITSADGHPNAGHGRHPSYKGDPSPGAV